MHPLLKHSIYVSLRVATLAAIASFPLAATAAESQEPRAATGAVVSPQAQLVVDRMTAFLRSLPTFSIESELTRDELVAFGYKLQHHESATVTVQRPNRLRASLDGDLRKRTFVYDGRRLSLYSPDDQAFAQAAAPDTLQKLIEGLFAAGVELPLVDVIYQATNGTLTEGVRGGVLVGTSIIDGVPCDHLAFRQGRTDWQLWVQQGDQSLPRKIVVTTRYEYGDPQFQANLRWNLAPRIDANTFTFDPPKGAVEITLENATALQGGEP